MLIYSLLCFCLPPSEQQQGSCFFLGPISGSDRPRWHFRQWLTHPRRPRVCLDLKKKNKCPQLVGGTWIHINHQPCADKAFNDNEKRLMWAWRRFRCLLAQLCNIPVQKSHHRAEDAHSEAEPGQLLKTWGERLGRTRSWFSVLMTAARRLAALQQKKVLPSTAKRKILLFSGLNQSGTQTKL